MGRLFPLLLSLLGFVLIFPSASSWSAGTQNNQRGSQKNYGLNVTTPNGGESWTTGKSYNIKWSKGLVNPSAYFKIELLKSGKVSLTISKSTINDGKHKWKVPSTVKTGSKYKIKITAVGKNTITDSSDKNFTITKAGGGGGSSLKVSTPNGGESWTTGKSYQIKWSKGNAGSKVKIELLKSGKKSLTISKKTKNDGKHKWKVPSTVKTGSKYKIKITSSTKKTVTDSSDKNFTITKASGGGGSSLKVSTPNGGESWTTGKSYQIKWSKGNAGSKVKIELLKSGKASLTISKKTKNDGKHKWKVPSTVKTGSKYKIRITSSTKKTITDSSDSTFTITKAGGG
jgi:predicted RNA-binding protein with TRAM domain